MNFIFPKLRNRISFLFIFILIIPAFWYNISLIGFNDDEAIRALVALEMDLSGNFIVPTLNGMSYYAKPPLYNWILSAYAYIFGGYTEFNTRTVTILFLILFSIIIYFFSKPYFTKRYALINALIFLTCGRIIFWDSMLGYIDIAYSMVCYLSFMVIYKFHKAQNYLLLFILSYSLMAVGFLMKGIPSLIFQFITLAVVFYFFDKWKNAFSWNHLMGLLSATIILGGYYALYDKYLPYQSSFETLIDQSSRRTVLVKGIPQTLKFILEFPFEYIYHFLPWSIMIILIFKKNLMSRILSNSYLKFCWYVFLFNIPIYWLSPGTIPRYVLMLLPLLFTVFLATYQIHRKQNTIEIKILDYIFLLALAGSIIYSAFPMISSRFVDYSYRYWLSGILIIGFAYLSYRFIINKMNRLLTLILCILMIRIGFNAFYLPEKSKETRLNICKTEAIRIAEKYIDHEIKVDSKSKIGNLASFYISNRRHKILPRVSSFEDKESIYIFNKKRMHQLGYTLVIDSIMVCEDPGTLYLVQAMK